MAFVKREIYEVHMGYVNDKGYHASDPEGYPKIVDSKSHENDIEKTRQIAFGYLGAAESYLANRDNQVAYGYIIRSSDGMQIEKRRFGKIKDVEIPDPEPNEGV